MTILRLYSQGRDGRLEDMQHEIGLSECGGVCPAPGDHILASRDTVWDVKSRYFKSKGGDDYIVLVVEERDARADEIDLF
jgi:hypothetical protein